MSLLILQLEQMTSRSLLSKLVVDASGWIQLYNSATAMMFGYAKFYIEDNGVRRLKDLISDEYEAEFKNLAEDSYFKKNNNKVIGPLRVANGRIEKDIQTKVSFVSMGRLRDANSDLFEKIYLVECWIPDVYTQLQIAGPKERIQSTRMIELEEDKTIETNFHLSMRIFALGNKKEQDMVKFSNMKFFLDKQTHFSTKYTTKNQDYSSGVVTKYLLPNGAIADRPFRLATEEEDLDLLPMVSEEDKQKEENIMAEIEVNEKQSSEHEWSLESKISSNDLHGKIISKKTEHKFSFLRVLLISSLSITSLFSVGGQHSDNFFRVERCELRSVQRPFMVLEDAD